MLYPIDKKLAECDAIAGRYKNDNTKYVRDFHTSYVERGLFTWDVFGDGVEMLFEGKMYIVPSQYEAYLCQYYGDYMTPPPVENRNSGHTFLYVNTEKRLSNEELQPIIKQLRSEHTYQFGIKRECRMLCGKIKECLGK